MPIAQYPAITGKNHTDAEYKKFLKQDFSSNFGVDKKSMAGSFVNATVNNVYNLSEKQVLNDVIPYLEKELGGYTTFLTKAIVEGGGTQCNYLNHYSPTGMAGCQVNYMDGLKVDVDMVKATLNGHEAGANGSETNTPLKVNLSSFESNYEVWPEDNPGSAEKMFNDMPKNSIGIHYMSMTHAGNGWVFQTSTAEQQWTGNPYSIGNAYDQFIKMVNDMGGDAFKGNKGGNDNQDNNENNNSDNDDNDDFLGIDWEKLFPNDPIGAVKKAINGIMDKIEEMTQWDMHSIGTDKHFSNRYFYLIKTYNNTYKLKLNTSFFDDIQDFLGNINNDADASENDKDDKDDNKGDNDDKGKDKGKNGINTCSLHLDRNVMQWFHGTKQDAINNGYPYPSAHHGIDLRFKYEPVKAVMSGTVEDLRAGENPATNGGIGYDGDGYGWGNRISIKNKDGRGTLYAHLSEIKVKPGDKIKVGDTIAISGNSGEQTNTPHLHFELYDPKNSPYPDGRVNPLKFIKEHCSDFKGLKVEKDDSFIQ